jgi:hypothetical protein
MKQIRQNGKPKKRRSTGGAATKPIPAAELTGASSEPASEKANWGIWCAIPTVQLRDAVALSLDLEPDSVNLDNAEFANRLKIAVANVRDRRILKLNLQSPEKLTHPAYTPVWLPHFAAWAKLKPGWDVPPILAQIAQSELSSADKVNPGPSERLAAKAKNWQDAVRKLADEVDKADQKAGSRMSKRAIAARVAIEAIKRGIIGPSGPLTASTILRAALQGNQWTRIGNPPAQGSV